ncbi:3-oxoacyl-[acyl-carrier protein] reductase [hydrothermal vent metagenome]|uniref:3-oxoacyl-[acyl-carrier protein] reductase n=1 Tax=hydrothermal vent metagenome TaxID=652676 RepID=A0A3B0WAG2_9ZZZZ
MSKQLEGEIALVTGASRGIGKAIAQQLAEQGATVIGTATSDSGADDISAYLAEMKMSGGGKGMCLNVTDVDSIAAVIKAITDEFGAVSILVNNAGITKDNLLMMMKEDQWNDIIETNLTSIYRLSKVVIRAMMKKRKGRIINIASVVGMTGNPGQTNYSATKAGMLGFTKSLAREIGSRNITVNCVAPGFIDTDMTKELPEEKRNALIGQIPLSRLGDPADIAAAVTFLAGPAAAYITGETINVNGGMYMP